jgi:hypothetical protein
MHRAFLALWHIPGRIWAGMMAAAPARNWAQVGAAMVLTLVLIGYGVVIWKGPWPMAQAGKQLELLGQGQLMAGFLVLVAVVCITGLTLNLNVSKEGLKADLERDDPPPPAPAAATTTTTTTTEILP